MSAFPVFFVLFYLAFLVFMIASVWKVFEKAGKPGWAILIPIYNLVVFLEIVNKPLWWILLFFIPGVNFAAALMLNIELAKSFGKDSGFGLGLTFLSFIFYPILGFGDAQHLGGTAAPLGLFNAFSQNVNVADEIGKLDELFRKGAITFEEFEARKARLLR